MGKNEFDGFIFLPHESGETNRIAGVYWVVGACGISASGVLGICIPATLADVYRHALLHRFRTGRSECRTGIFNGTFTRRRAFPVSSEIARVVFGLCRIGRCRRFLSGFCRLAERHAGDTQAECRSHYQTRHQKHQGTSHFSELLLVYWSIGPPNDKSSFPLAS